MIATIVLTVFLNGVVWEVREVSSWAVCEVLRDSINGQGPFKAECDNKEIKR